MQSFRRVLTFQCKQWRGWIFTKRQCSQSVVPVSELVEKSNYLFSQEQKRQLEEVGRVEKIAVAVHGAGEDAVLMMNQNISTPYDCCKHMSLALCYQSPLALINDSMLWDMHRPLPDECSIRFLNFRDKDPFTLNEVFWRTGSFILGAVIKKAFKDEAGVLLHPFPDVQLSSGSFIYDAELKLREWEPSIDELKILSGEFITFVAENHKIERLDVKKTIAAEMFEGNPHKLLDIKKLATEREDRKVTLYRVGNHIDINGGPMLGNTSFFGRCTVTAVHRISNFKKYPLYRFQGVALPKGILLNSYAYTIICNRGRNINILDVHGLEEDYQPRNLPDNNYFNFSKFNP